MQSVSITRTDDGGERKHRVVGINMGGVFGRLLDSVHLSFAGGVIKGADHNRLLDFDVFCPGQVGLKGCISGQIYMRTARGRNLPSRSSNTLPCTDPL